MITRLKLQHYRSIEDLDLELGPVTVFVGRNGSGKSNIIDAIKFVTDRHGMANIRQWSPKRPYDVTVWV